MIPLGVNGEPVHLMTRSTEPWPWREMSRQMMFTPARLASFIVEEAERAKRRRGDPASPGADGSG